MAFSAGMMPPAKQIGRVKAVDLEGSFAVAAGAITAGSSRGQGWTAARTSAGLFTVTPTEVPKRVMGFQVTVGGTAALFAVASVNDTTGVATISIFSDAGAATDPTGRVYFKYSSDESNSPVR